MTTTIRNLRRLIRHRQSAIEWRLQILKAEKWRSKCGVKVGDKKTREKLDAPDTPVFFSGDSWRYAAATNDHEMDVFDKEISREAMRDNFYRAYEDDR